MAFLTSLPVTLTGHAANLHPRLGNRHPPVALRPPRRSLRAAPSMQTPPPSDNTPGNTPSNPGPPEGSLLTQALEVSFRNVWIRLMTSGVGQEYNDAIVAFVVAVAAAYKAGYSINALKFELAANERTDVIEGRSIALNEQEKETRLIWIVLVYLTLKSCRFTSERELPNVADELSGTKLEDLLSGLTSLVEAIREAERKGFSLEAFKMELNVQSQTASSDKSTESKVDSFTGPQANIRSQWSRIVFSTLRIIPEAQKGSRP